LVAKIGGRVLIVNDERNVRAAMRISLGAMGCRVWEADSVTATLIALDRERIDLVFLDRDLAIGSLMRRA
jgi:DNA-binding NtrC family response regulator